MTQHTYQVGDLVKIISSDCAEIPSIADMVGNFYHIQSVHEFGCIINGWAFTEDEIELVK